MRLRRNYWVYSASLALAWALVFAIRAAIGDRATMNTVLKVFAGFAIGWVSTTIARYVYPPPAKWTKAASLREPLDVENFEPEPGDEG
jgi:hypothetical protein